MAPGKAGRVTPSMDTPSPKRQEPSQETRKHAKPKRQRRNGDEKGELPPEASETEIEVDNAEVEGETIDAREAFVKKSVEDNSVHDKVMWPTERLSAAFGEAWDMAEKGIFEGHSQRELM